MDYRVSAPILKVLTLFLFLVIALSPILEAEAQTNVITGTIGAYSFQTGSFEIISRAKDMFSPVEIISEGTPPSNSYTYVAEANGDLSIVFESTAGGYPYLEVNGAAYGYTDGFNLRVSSGESVSFTLSAPAKQTDYTMTQADSGEVTFTDIFSWDSTTGVVTYSLNAAMDQVPTFSWSPLTPVIGDDVWIHTPLNTMLVKDVTWFLNGFEVTDAHGASQWDLINIQDGAYEVTLRVTDLYDVVSEITNTITVGDQQILYGVIFDDLDNRYQDLTVHLYWDNVLQGTTWTDEDGYYEFTEINGQPITLPVTGAGEIKIEFIDKDHVFEVRDEDLDIDNAVSVTYPIQAITSEAQLEYNIGFYGDMADDPDTPKVNEQRIDEHALIYYYTNMAARFYDEKLGYFFWNTPVYIVTKNSLDNEAFFRSGNNPIMNGKTDYPMIQYTSPAIGRTDNEVPINREFHEFSHYVMWDDYGKFPPLHGDYNAANNFVWTDVNHDGFSNHCTSDSYVEGFAEFMALVINKEMDVQSASTSLLPDFVWSRYPIGKGQIHLEYNIKQTTVEELSLAGILWDLYDGKEAADKDNIDLTIEDIWILITQPYTSPLYYRYNPATGKTDKLPETDTEFRYIHYIKDLYDGLLENEFLYSYTVDDVNSLFISHSFFTDTNGDGVRQLNEPVGLNTINHPDRRKQPVDPTQLLSIDVAENLLPCELKISVTHPTEYSQYDHEYTVPVTQTPVQIPLMMPPAQYEPTMTVEVIKSGYIDTDPLQLDLDTYENIIASQGNLGTHTPTITSSADDYVVINDLDAPQTVETGSPATITVTLDYSFNELTQISIGIYDYTSETNIAEEYYWVQGTEVEDFVIQLTSPDSAGTLDLEANVVFQQGDEWYYTEDDQWYTNFTVNVVKPSPGIPGYSILSLLTGLSAYLISKKNRGSSTARKPNPL